MTQSSLMKSRRSVLTAFLGSGVGLALPAGYAYAASDFPNRPVHLVVPSSPGGSLDLVARIVGERLQAMWKQPVIIENRPGANFVIGTSYVAKQPADGYTLLFAHDGVMAMNPALFPDLSYSPLRDFAPISQIVILPTLLWVNKDVAAANVGELVALIRKSPGGLNHASGGTAAFMGSQMFKYIAKLEYVDVPYKGAGPAALATAAGETQFTFADPPSASAVAKSGMIRPLGVASVHRIRLMPDLPTIAESLPGYDTTSWSGMYAPSGTPKAVIDKINADVRAVVATPEVTMRLETLGVEPATNSTDEFVSLIRKDLEKWARLVKERDIKLLP